MTQQWLGMCAGLSNVRLPTDRETYWWEKKTKIKWFNLTKTKNERSFTLKRVEIHYITHACVMVSALFITVLDFFLGLLVLSLYSVLVFNSYLFKNHAFRTLT